MTGYDPSQDPIDRLGLTPAPRLREDTGFWQRFEDATLLGSPFGWAQTYERFRLAGGHDPVPGFDPLADREALRGYEPWLRDLMEARSPAEFEGLKTHIDNNLAARRRLDEGGRFWPQLLVSLGDPVNLLALPAKGATMAATAARSGLAIGAGTAVSELPNLLQDPTQTAEEYGYTVGASLLLGSVLGSAAHYLPNPLPVTARAINQGLGFNSHPTAVPSGTAKGGLDPDAIRPAGGFERFDFFGQDSYTAVKNSPVPEVQRLADEIVGNPGLETKGVRGTDDTYAVAQGAEVKTFYWQGQNAKAHGAIDDAFLRYRGSTGSGWLAARLQQASDWAGRRGGSVGPDILPLDAFADRIGRAVFNGDKDLITDAASPFVEEAARSVRQLVFDPMGRQLDAHGLIGGASGLLKNAMREDVWLAKLQAHRDKWQAIRDQVDQQLSAGGPASSLLGRLRSLDSILADIDTKLTAQKTTVQDLYQKAQDALTTGKGRGPQQDPTFAPRYWLRDKVGDVPEPLKVELRDWVAQQSLARGITPNPQWVEKQVGEILAHIRRDPLAVGTPLPGANGMPSTFVSRRLDISSLRVLDYLETDIRTMIDRYTRQTAPILELGRKFGDHQMKETLTAIQTAIGRFFLKDVDWASGVRMTRMVKRVEEEAIVNSMDEARLLRELDNPFKVDRSALSKEDAARFDQAEAEIARATGHLETLRDKVLGTYKTEDPLSWTKRTADAAKNVQISTLMGKSGLVALSDIAGALFREGWAPLLRDSVALIQDRRLFKQIHDELLDMGEAAEIRLGQRMVSVTDYAIDTQAKGRIERLLQNSAGLMFHANGLNAWTSAMKTIVGATVMSRIAKDTKAWVAGSASPEQIAGLKRIGISKQSALEINNQLALHGQNSNSLVLPNLSAWGNTTAAETFRGAVSLANRSAIVTPGAADRLNFMHSSFGSVVTQFLGFPLAAHKRMMLAGMQQRDAKFAQAVVASVGLGMLIDWIRTPDWADKSIDERLMKGFETSAFSGVLLSANTMLETASGNGYGLRPLLGIDPVIEDLSPADRIAGALGPTASHIATIVNALSPDAEVTDPVRAVRRSLLFNNLWLFGTLPQQLQASAVEALE